MTDRAEGPVSLYSLATWINGLAFKAINFSEAGMPVIKISEVKNGLTSQTKFTDGSYASKFLVEPGAMIFCWSGQPETSIGTFYWRGPRGWLNQHLFKVIPDSERVDPEYFYFLMQDLKPLFVQLARNKQTTGLGHVTKQDLIRTEVALPPLDEQRRIAEVLGTLDDLIDTNERLANTQTALANAHGQLLLSRFSEGDVGTVDDIATIAKGYSYKSAELVEGGGWLVGLKNVGRRGEFRADGFKPLNAEVKPSQVVENGDLVVAHTDLTQAREVIGRPVRVRRGKREGTLVASLDLAVVRPKPGVSVEYLQAVLESPAFREHALGYCNGTTVLHMSSQAVPSFPVVVPTAERMSAFEELSALRAGADDAYDAADELRLIRDELLPLLMSGAVRVRPEEVAA